MPLAREEAIEVQNAHLRLVDFVTPVTLYDQAYSAASGLLSRDPPRQAARIRRPAASPEVGEYRIINPMRP